MQIIYKKVFLKDFKKTDNKIKVAFGKKLEQFMEDRSNPTLNVHELKGDYTGFSSMNVTGDFRALFYFESDDICIFTRLGTHSELYR